MGVRRVSDTPPDPRLTPSQVRGCGERLDKQTIEGFISRSVEREGRQVDLGVPQRQHSKIRLEWLQHRERQRRLGASCASGEAIAKLERGHGLTDERRPTNAPSTATAA